MDTPLNKRIEQKLQQALQPTRLEIKDESHLHAGHSGHRPGKSTHFRLLISSASFDGLSQIQKHRLIYTILKEEMAHEIHALSITIPD